MKDGAPILRSGSSAHPSDPIPKNEPRSRYGNGPYYTVFGKTYKVLESSYGYQKSGVASWYGTKFHGRRTSSGEPYDMYAMTAAHKSLPLPTYARVRNLTNNRSIIVRVNDRGPFVDNRLIDLSYAAARKLDLIRDGTGLVEVTAISFDRASPVDTYDKKISTIKNAANNPPKKAKVFVQVGAFVDRSNAERRLRLLESEEITGVFMDQEKNTADHLYRVRIGPIVDVINYDRIVTLLRRIGIHETHLVTN
tara:strand:- start:582 stop:1334 length:753 start_codon:yes stop_codon:yes gene_type:complete